MITSDIYLPDTDYYELHRDPAHPHPLRDRVIETLGEIGGVWPESVWQE